MYDTNDFKEIELSPWNIHPMINLLDSDVTHKFL